MTYRYTGSDIVVGGILGVLGATMNQTSGHNMVASVGASLAGSAIDTYLLKGQDKFLSSQTALSTVVITGSSALTYMITDALIHKHHKPAMKIEIQHNTGTPCKPGWAERLEIPPQDPLLSR